MADSSNSERAFADRVLGNLDRFRRVRASIKESVELSHSDRQGVATVTTGHPDFTALPLGASGTCDAVAVFIDLEQFTQRTFWDPPEEMVFLAHGVLAEVARTVVGYGGYVLGLRGDGLFACFGCARSTPQVDAALALAAGTYVMNATREVLNPILISRGIQPVQMRVGADYGRLDFVRIGTPEISEVNVVGFAANFAAKCEKYADSWEYVVGEGFQGLLNGNDRLFTHHPDSPKRYTRNYVTRSYRFYDVSWRSLIPDLPGIVEQLAGSPTKAISIY